MFHADTDDGAPPDEAAREASDATSAFFFTSSTPPADLMRLNQSSSPSPLPPRSASAAADIPVKTGVEAKPHRRETSTSFLQPLELPATSSSLTDGWAPNVRRRSRHSPQRRQQQQQQQQQDQQSTSYPTLQLQEQLYQRTSPLSERSSASSVRPSAPVSYLASPSFFRPEPQRALVPLRSTAAVASTAGKAALKKDRVPIRFPSTGSLGGDADPPAVSHPQPHQRHQPRHFRHLARQQPRLASLVAVEPSLNSSSDSSSSSSRPIEHHHHHHHLHQQQPPAQQFEQQQHFDPQQKAWSSSSSSSSEYSSDSDSDGDGDSGDDDNTNSIFQPPLRSINSDNVEGSERDPLLQSRRRKRRHRSETSVDALTAPVAPTDRLSGFYLAPFASLADVRQLFSHRVKSKRYRDIFVASIDGHRTFFVFRSGVVVTWGCSERAEQLLVQSLLPFTESPDARYEPDLEEQMTFQYGSVAAISMDRVTIPGNRGSWKLAISFALAQSIKLAVFESFLERNVASMRELAQAMATTGEIRANRQAVVRGLGELYVLRLEINLTDDVNTLPRFIIDRPRLQPYYHATRKYLNLADRLEILNGRLELIDSMFQVLNSELATSHGVFLEWIVIVLVVLEALFELVSILIEVFLRGKT